MTTNSLEFSLRYLITYDLRPLSATEESQASLEDNVKSLVNKIWELPSKRSTPDGVVVDLPRDTSIKIPRILPIPAVKAPTKWEKFAQKKGIVKQKRSRMVWDENTKDWAPRWGYKSKAHNEKAANPIIELKPGQKPTDVFEERSKAKQIHKTKQKMRELRNQMDSANYPQGVPNLQPNVKSRKTSKFHLDESLRRAQHATASHGRYDRPTHNEATKKRPLYSKVTTKNIQEEKAEYSKILKRVLSSGK